jgi:hypothetical protein
MELRTPLARHDVNAQITLPSWPERVLLQLLFILAQQSRMAERTGMH